MYVQHAAAIWREFPQLRAGVVVAEGITPDADVDGPVAALHDAARARLAAGPEGEFPEIQAWRRAFARMGLKPTQYRCAAESLLRRFRKEGTLPRIHPLIDLCNAVSLAYAVPVAAFDLAAVAGFLEVRHATGEESYLTFAGQVEHPEAGEVIFVDAAGQAHARRWCHRQSGHSAVRGSTGAVVLVAEAMHGDRADVERLADAVGGVWRTAPRTATLDAAAPRADF
ncbi:MAG TPA: phenylalanine--tRNA ligase beta subunit-related protein [Pilimelia sp.]|nr:phenylalanine--tRNA ligase beta subunit-related protein [Pilimelia sp.]